MGMSGTLGLAGHEGGSRGLNGSALPPKVLFVTSEAFPLAKTGGLADVSAALPLALTELGVDVRLLLPAYPQALDLLLEKRVVARLDDARGNGRLIQGRMPDTGLSVYLYDSPSLYQRHGSLYQNEDGEDWPDNHLRYSSLCHAAARIALGVRGLGWKPDTVHANDWHAALIPAILESHGGSRPATVLTIHNMAFQGNFPLCAFTDLGLPGESVNPDALEFYGQVSFLKAGLLYSDRLTTVSPTYAKEILTPEYGCGLDGVLRARADDLVGILNGVDYRIWDPAADQALPCQYSANDPSGKSACKAAVQDEFGLSRTDAPLVAFVNRLTQQKMADVVIEALPAILEDGAQFVLHGQGDKALEERFSAAAQRHAGQVAVRIGYQEELARKLNAAADIALTASRFEPCGLTTMYAMRYGALPVTRHVGGLVDTVVDPESEKADEEGATGFVFDDETPETMAAGLRRASHWFRKRDWGRIQRSAMQRDFGWERSAQRYLNVYRQLCSSGRDSAAERQVA